MFFCEKFSLKLTINNGHVKIEVPCGSVQGANAFGGS